MKTIKSVALLAFLFSCAHEATFVHTDTTLGRVVIYRNGVAYFERSATVAESSLDLSVPADKVDDFLRSLTVIDADTGLPTPVSYPTQPALEGGTGLIAMKIGLQGNAPHRLKLSYVTEAPSWKPSYRLTLTKPGTVEIQGWAVVDNNSGEDWNKVKLGVGSSSAMSFRFDLHSVRIVERETLRSNDLFAQAPPTGGSTYAQTPGAAPVVAELSDSSLAAAEAAAAAKERPPMSVMASAAPEMEREMVELKSARRSGGAAAKKPSSRMSKDEAAPAPVAARRPAPAPPADDKIVAMARRLQSTRDQIVIEGFADRNDSDKDGASLARANRMREQLIRNGLAPDRVVAVGRGVQSGHNGGVRVVQQPVPAQPKAAGPAAAAPPAAQDPIGTAHFESETAMDVPRGSSAMVSILKKEASGEVVYLYDAESSRGNDSFPFKSIRLLNPTDSVLESGPVTVFGEGRFIGEGLVEPIPARSAAFIPYALDRQVVVERKNEDRDEIARIITVQRGVFSTEARHIRKTSFIMHNRQDEKVAVYVRHTVQQGYKLTKSPKASERMNAAHLFRVDIEPKGKAEVVIEETTPVFKTTDIRAAEGMEVIRAYLSSAALAGALKDKVTALLNLQKEQANLEQQITTTREQMQEYRNRMDELHAQIVTLTDVKAGASLLKDLQKKMQSISEKVSQATIQIVNLQEKQMIARINFQDAVAELTLEDASKPAIAAEPAAEKTPVPAAAPVPTAPSRKRGK